MSASPRVDRDRHEALEEVGVDRRAARRALDERGLGRASLVAGPLRARRCVLEGRERPGRLRGELVPRAVARRAEADGHAAEPRDDDVRRGGGPRALRRLAPRLELERGQASQLLRELVRAALARRSLRVDRRLEPGDELDGPPQAVVDAVDDGDEPAEHLRVGGLAAQVRDGRVRRLGLRQADGRLVRLAAGSFRARGELIRLVRKRATSCLQLEQDALARLAREPGVAAVGVVALAVRRDRDAGRDLPQLGALHEPDAVEQPHRVVRPGDELRQGTRTGDRGGGVTAALRRDDHGEVAEPARTGALDEGERVLTVGGEERRRAPGERRRDRLLVPGCHLERGERQALALVGQRPRGGRDSLALLERALQRGEPLAGRAGALGEIVTLSRRRARLDARVVGLPLELCRIGGARACVRAGRLVALPQLSQELDAPLVPAAQPLARGAEADEGAMRRAVHSRETLQTGVDRLALPPDGIEPLLGAIRGRTLRRREQRVGVPGPLGRLAPDAGGVAGGGGGRARGRLEGLHRLVAS